MLTLQMAHGAIVASGGLLDFVSAKTNELIAVLRLLSIAFGMGFIVWRAIASRGAAAPIVISTLCAAFFIWAVWNVTAVKDRVNTEVNSGAVLDDRSVALQALTLRRAGLIPCRRPVASVTATPTPWARSRSGPR